MKILILGCGAIGGYFGGRLQQAGLNVTFLVREHRQEILHANGLSITSPFGDAHLQVNTVTKDNLNDTYDLILLTCKSYDLDDAIDAIEPAVGNKTIIIPLLNGLNHYEKLDEKFKAANVIGGFCFLSVTMDGNGNIQHLSNSHSLTVGARQTNQASALELLWEKIGHANFTFKVSNNILVELWAKFTFLCSAAALNCMMRGNIGMIMNARFGHQIILAVLEESYAVASAYGYILLEADKQLAVDQLTKPNSSFETSMYKDMKSGHRTEFEHIVGDMVNKGRKAGVQTPYLLVALTHLEVFENSLISEHHS